MIQSIREQLGLLREIYGELLKLAQEKQPVLQANKDHEAVSAFTEKESVLAAQASRIERDRMAMVRDLSAQWGVPAEDLTVYEIAQRAGGQEGEALLNEAKALVEVLQKLQWHNQINRELIEMNLSFAAFMLDNLVREQSPSSIYGASGGELDEENRRPILDSEI